MRIQLKWFLSQKQTPFEERDDLLNPKTTVLEIKGLIQIAYTYPAKNMLLIARRSLLENHETLASIGIVDQASADAAENVILVHVLTPEEMDGDDEAEPTAADGAKKQEPIWEFSHADFIKASKMLGRDVGVGKDRSAVVKAEAPRGRPTFLDAQQQQPSAVPAGPESEVHKIFRTVMYGLRKPDVEKKMALHYPGVAEPFDFWDVRLSHEGLGAAADEICVDLFYFGEFDKVKGDKFHALMVESLSQQGFRIKPVGQIREAGCMYPLIATPVLISESEAMLLGDAVFERFGVPVEHAPAPTDRPAAQGATAGGARPGECCVM